MNIIEIPIADIVIGKAFRKDMGDIVGLAASITELGLLQPIGITSDNELVFGSRRIAAYRHLNRTMIRAHVVEIDSILRGTFAENELRKQFTPTERVAILKAIKRRPQGRHASSEDIQMRPEEAVVRAGLGNTTTARYATQIVDDGAEELVAAMETGKLPIDRAHLILNAGDHAEQRRILQLPARQQTEVIRDLREARSRRGATKHKKKPVRPPRPQAEPLPTYWPELTLEQQGFPPRETWEEPDPDRPGLNRYQGFIAKHGHVHIMPLRERQAQDSRIAARLLNSQVRNLAKQPMASLMTSDPMPIDLEELAAILGAMDDAARIIDKLATTLAEVMPDITKAYRYLQALQELIDERRVKPNDPLLEPAEMSDLR